MSANEVKEYDEDEAIKFIKNKIQNSVKTKYSNDDILTVIDIVFDYYDEQGFLDIDSDDDEAMLSETDLIGYVKNQLRKDSDNEIDIDDVKHIVLAELEYEETLGIY